MARGYPDYFGASVWPKYGNPLLESFDVDIMPNTTARLLDVSAQGVMLYTHIQLLYFDDYTDVKARVILDGVTAFELSLYQMLRRGYVYGVRLPLILTYANLEDGEVALCTGLEIPFHASIAIEIITGISAGFTNATGDACYYVVT